ncbi:MAG TPA: hypothetical protein PKW13_05755 [Rhodoglobus sp.]|jgi:hypothetical protein|nr:hypothetical protein [Rhodoglobus sp.]HQA23205.1 hypothetical protein [Rhodoglobus sp.]HQI65477.1 hypothetical protein [Rhodoglobus sp.]
MEILKLVLVAAHFLGMAAIVGSFFVQMRRKSDFVLTPLLAGAITQVVTGLALVGLAEATGDDLIYAKIAVKLTLAVVVLVAAILAVVTQRKGGRVQPWFHAAGGLAVINVLVAVFWG